MLSLPTASKMVSCLPVCGFVFSLVALAAYACATATDYWIKWGEETYVAKGLWKETFCLVSGSTSICSALKIGIDDQPAYMHIARACMIVAGLVSVVAVLLALVGFVQAFGSTKIKVGGVLMILSASAAATATIWFAIEEAAERDGTDYEFGYSIIVGWVSVPLAVIGGCLLLTTYSRH